MDKVAVITGATSGIGLACALELHRRGFRVYGIARHPREIPGITLVCADVSEPQSVAQAFDHILSAAGRIDLLVNNAGFGIAGAIEFTPMEQIKSQLDVNFFGAIHCIQAALPHLRASQGRIINISSMSAVFSIPFQAAYSASKWAINGLTFALANEVRAFGVSVCAVMPGDIHTGFTAQRQKELAGHEVYGKTIEKSIAVMERDEQNGASPDTIGKYVGKIAVKKRVRPLYAVGFPYKLFAYANKLLPAALVNWILHKMYVKTK